MRERQCSRKSGVYTAAVTVLVLLICMSGRVFAQASFTSENSGLRLEAVYAAMQGQSGGNTSGDALVGLLKDSDSNVRELAAEALGKMKYKPAVEPLKKCLADPDVWVRAEAAAALGKIGDKSAVDALIEATKNSDPWVMSHGIAALGELGDVKTIDTVMAGLKGNGRLATQEAVNALKKIGAPAVGPLLKAAETASGGDLDVLADALAGCVAASPDAVRNSLNSPNARVKAAAARALGLAGGDDNIALLLPLLADKEPQNCIIGLAAVQGSKDSRVTAQARELLKDKNEVIRTLSARMLGSARDSSAVDLLIACLKDKSVGVRVAAARSLGLIGDARSIDPLSSAIKDMNLDIRTECMKALVKFKDARTIPALFFAVGDSSAWAKAVTSEYLEVASSAAVGSVMDSIQSAIDTVNTGSYKSPDLNKRANAASARQNYEDAYVDAAMTYLSMVSYPAKDGLVGIGTPGLDQFIKAASDRNSDIRAAAVDILGKIKAPEAFDVAAKALEDRDSKVRLNAVFALGHSDDPRKTALLEKASKDKDSSVRKAAERYSRGRLQSNATATDINSLREKLSNTDKMIAGRAALELSVSDDPQAAQALKDAVEQGNTSALTGGYRLFVKIPDKGYESTLISLLKQNAEASYMGPDGKPAGKVGPNSYQTTAMAGNFVRSGNPLLEMEARKIAQRWGFNLD